jgi:hypothetical protein
MTGVFNLREPLTAENHDLHSRQGPGSNLPRQFNAEIVNFTKLVDLTVLALSHAE